ncbi:MAG: InlB B-repeat-containing protein, partial [Clostridia bacterium]|nr:InlB B-repeat-containing protein [Clostridia bacterium]
MEHTKHAKLTRTDGTITMQQEASGEYYANFASAGAQVNLADLISGDLNYYDGFTITFNALAPSATASNTRFFDISNNGSQRTNFQECYTHMSPVADKHGAYIGNFNGPLQEKTSGFNSLDVRDWIGIKKNLNDNTKHEYLISYANGNIIMYLDGEVVLKRNRFTNTDTENTRIPLDDNWYKEIGNSVLRIGKSYFDDPLFTGTIQDFCIYDASMSYYDILNVQNKQDIEAGIVNDRPTTYNGMTNAYPRFEHEDSGSPTSSDHYSNIFYWQSLPNMPEGTGESNNPDSGDFSYMAATAAQSQYTNVGIYYPNNTVLYYDGINTPKMPVMLGARLNKNKYDSAMITAYPSASASSTADNANFYLTQNWVGHDTRANYPYTMTKPQGTSIGHNSSTRLSADLDDANTQGNREIRYFASVLALNEDNVTFNSSGYQKYNPSWYWEASTSGSNSSSGNASNNEGTPNHNIWVVDIRDYVELRNLVAAEFDSMISNKSYCPAAIENYKSVVLAIQNFDPRTYNYATGVEAAIQLCCKQIDQFKTEYEAAKALLGPCKTSSLAAKEPTCAVNGYTEGSFCNMCGKVYKEQEVITTLPHAFGDIFTEENIQYKECSTCGIRVKYAPYEVRYENLFSFNRWNNSASKGVFNGTITTDIINGTITIVNNNNSEIYTKGTYDGQNLVSTRDFSNNCIPVTGGKSYVVEATSLASSTSGGDVFVFQYNKDGLAYSAIPGVISGLAPGETRNLAFTVDANAAYIELRFDANDAGKTITFSQIGVYEKENFDRFGATTADARLGFYPGDNKELCFPNPAPGYTFDGWYTKSGIRIENVYQLNNPTTVVYGKWIAAGYDVIYDSIFSFSNWAKSSCNQLWYGDAANGDRLVSKEGIVADAENGTITIYNDEDTNNFARTNLWVDSGNLYTMPVKANTDYVIEYTATSNDGGKPSVCAYFSGSASFAGETGQSTRYSPGTHRVTFNSGNNTGLVLRFDNSQHGSTVTYSNIAVYEAELFLDHANNITNREYRRYYHTKMGIGDVFEYTPTRPGYTFDTWMAETNFGDDKLGDFNMRGFDDTFLVENNWHLYSTWTENSYKIVYNANNGLGSVESQTAKYTENVTLASSGFTRIGYALIGWSTIPNATSAQYQLGQTVNRLNGDANGTTTLYAVWGISNINVTFDNLIDFSAWNKVAGDGTVSDVTNTGFTITSNEGVGESTSSSPYFPVEPGKQYKIDIDFEGNNWDVYIFFCDANGTWIEFADGPS